MRRRRRNHFGTILALALFLLVVSFAVFIKYHPATAENPDPIPPPIADKDTKAAATAIAYLAQRLDQFQQAVDIYTDADAAGNHFVARGAMPKTIPPEVLPPMQEACEENP